MIKGHASALSFAAVVVLGLLGTTAVCLSDTASERTDVKTATGVITDINVDSRMMTLKPEGSQAPVTYTFSTETIFVDAKGKVVSYETFKGSPVTLQYTVEGDRTIVNRVTKEDHI